MCVKARIEDARRGAPRHQATDGCNEGFLRDDAILVLTFITNDPPSPANDDAVGDPQVWYDAIVAAKQGNVDAVVVTGIMLWDDVSCHPFDIPTPPFIDFVDMWGDHGVKGSVCSDDFVSIFAEAVGVIDQTCDEFVPVD